MELKQCINYLLTVSQHKVFKEMSANLAAYDITPVQYSVLYCVGIDGFTSPAVIAGELRLENSTISGILERMEKKGLIQRKINLEDRRYIEVSLTETSQAMLGSIMEAVEKTDHDVMAGLTEEEGAALKKALEQLSANH